MCVCVQGAVERAKMQLKSAMMMNLESRFILCEDIGRCLSPSPNSLLPTSAAFLSPAPHSLTLPPSLGVTMYFLILESAVQYKIGWPKLSERVVRR